MKRLAPSVFLIALLMVGLQSSVSLAQLEPRSLSSFATQIQDQPVPLALEQAFPYFVSETSPGRLRVSWDIADQHYLYRHAFHFSLKQSADAGAAESEVEFILPEGVHKNDQFFGEIVAYYNLINVDLNLSSVPGPDSILVIEYQGCAEWGFCYPPQRSEFKLVP